ncbi:MAG: hypothetical protein RLZZ227_1928 [Pseudomonadota bacterium]|jgi:hypothetical protein
MPGRLLKQPLLHFLALGALLFVIYDMNEEQVASEPPAGDAASNTILVDRAALLDFLQFQAQAFEPAVFEARLAAMTVEEVDAAVAAFVREEALYREALKLNLDKGDYSIRQRLVQKVEFLLENLVAEDIRPTDAELLAWYETHRADYAVDAVYTFTHIFFDGQQDMDQARTRAENLLADSADIGFEQSAQHGDRYPFLQNYVERTRDFVANNFSADFVAQLDQLGPGDTWQGPFASRYGWHLVMLRARTDPFTPALSDIRPRVLDDYRYEAMARSRQDAEQRVISEYAVTRQLD